MTSKDNAIPIASDVMVMVQLKYLFKFVSNLCSSVSMQPT